MAPEFRRKIYDRMLEWKINEHSTRALMIEGPRRVGKSTVVEQFARKEYESHILINFSEAGNDIKDLFSDLRNLDRLFRGLQLSYGTTLIEGKSVIVFDEVQRFPRAREAIKFLIADGRYDYIETGSQISIRKNVKGITIPSEERAVYMHPMDFEEFLWACGRGSAYDILKGYFDDLSEIPGGIHHDMMRTYREYMAVGGMPQAVEAFIDGKDYRYIDSVKRDIIKLYLDDFMKYDPSGKTRNLFMGIPSELSRESHRYQISRVDPSLRYDKDRERIVEMCDSRTTVMSMRTTDPGPMMNSSTDTDRFKLYLEDTGLFITLCFYTQDFSDNGIYRDLVTGRISANLGYVYENAVSQALTASGNRLFYSSWRKENSTHCYEVDFLVADGEKVILIEVKSSKNTSHRSMDAFAEKHDGLISKRYVISQKNLRTENGVIYIPVYMTGFVRNVSG